MIGNKYENQFKCSSAPATNSRGYFSDNEILIQTSSVQGNSVAAFDLPALVISPCEGFLKDSV